MQKQITVRVSDQLSKELDIHIFGEKMQGEKISRNSLIVELIEKFLKEKKKRGNK